MPVDKVCTRGRQLRRRRDEIDVHPGVDAQTLGACLGDQRGERIEARGLTRQRIGTRLERALEVGVATSAHLHEQGIEPAGSGGLHDGADRARRRQAYPRHPERPDLVARGRRVRRGRE